MYGDELEMPKVSDPEEVEPLEDEDESDDEELTEEEEEDAARAEMGEICENCGAEFTEANGKAALCQECFDTAEDAGVKDHPPLSKYPVVS